MSGKLRQPGYFTELIRRHDWPPGFTPQLPVDSDIVIRNTIKSRKAKAARQGHAGTPLGLPGGEAMRRLWAEQDAVAQAAAVITKARRARMK